MVEKNRVVEVTNRDSGRIGYHVPDLGNLHRTFAIGETKKVTFEELEKLSWVPGGKKILKDYLIIHDKEAADELLGEVEPEYYYTEETVKELLTNGSLAQLQDALDFAPEGVVELIKKTAVELPLNNVAMREEIKKRTHFDVTKAIEVNKEASEPSDESEGTAGKRRANPVTATGRKTTPIIVKK